MLKMLLDPMGGIVITNDGNAILREIDVSHPAAKSLLEVSRTQDEEVGDGTTSVIILAGEMLHASEELLERGMHPTVIVGAYAQALDDAIDVIGERLCRKLDTSNEAELMKVVKSCLGTKFLNRFMELACRIAVDAVNIVAREDGGRREIDIKRYAKVEKVRGAARGRGRGPVF